MMTLDMLRVLTGLRTGFAYRTVWRNPHVAPSRNEVAVEELATHQLIESKADGGWTVTARGNVLLNHILALPLPVSTTAWEMPK